MSFSPSIKFSLILSFHRNGDYAPGVLADTNGLYDLALRHIDDGDVMGRAIGREQQALVRGKIQLPDPLSDEQIVEHLLGLAIYNRDPVRWPQSNESQAAIFHDLYAHRLYRFLRHARNFEADLLGDLEGLRIDDGDRAAYLRR